MSHPVRRYGLAQFAVAIVVALAIAELFLQSGAAAVLVPCVWLWAQLYTLGLLNEGRKTAFRNELIRLLLVTPILFLLFQQTVVGFEWAAGAWLMLAVYVVVSVLALFAASAKPVAQWRSIDGRS